MELRLEFTVEPFVDGRPGPHVRAALAEARRQGLHTEMGPFATTVDGEAEELLAGLAAIVGAAVAAGATRLALAVSRHDRRPEHPFLDALTPVAEALAARMVAPEELAAGDIPLAFDGEVLGGLRLPRAHGLLERLIAEVERELGGKLADLSREAKQRAVRLLDDRGAFNLRRSIEDVADALGVSRITVYNYLNAASRGAGSARRA
jgi:uncharacterized protein YqgV (UPF0045/DUF77 family)